MHGSSWLLALFKIESSTAVKSSNYYYYAKLAVTSVRGSSFCPPCTETMPEQYHAFATIQLCYPDGFYGNSIQALRLPKNTKPKHHKSTSSPTCHLSTTGLEVVRKSKAAVASLPSASTDTVAARNETIGLPDPTIPRRNSGMLGAKAGEEADPCGKPGGSIYCPAIPHSKSPPRRRCGSSVEATARAPRLQPLPSAARRQTCSVVREEENSDTRRGSGKLSHPTNHSMKQSGSSTAGCLSEVGDGHGYWDCMGRKADGGVHHNGGVRADVDQNERAVASVVLLRWVVECFVGNEDEGIVGGVPNGGHRVEVPTRISQVGDDAAGGASTFRGKGKAMNATISGPIHLVHSERKPRDSDLFPLSDIESNGKGSADTSSSPRIISSFAATSPTYLPSSRRRNSERSKEALQSIPREVRVSIGGGWERRSPPENNHRYSDLSVAHAPPGLETTNAANNEKEPGGRSSWTASRTCTTALRGESTEDVRSTTRYVLPKGSVPFSVCSTSL